MRQKHLLKRKSYYRHRTKQVVEKIGLKATVVKEIVDIVTQGYKLHEENFFYNGNGFAVWGAAFDI